MDNIDLWLKVEKKIRELEKKGYRIQELRPPLWGNGVEIMSRKCNWVFFHHFYPNMMRWLWSSTYWAVRHLGWRGLSHLFVRYTYQLFEVLEKEIDCEGLRREWEKMFVGGACGTH